MEKEEAIGIECESCHKRPAESNEFNYVMCIECLAYYMGIDIESLIEMGDLEQGMYWSLYEQEHNRL